MKHPFGYSSVYPRANRNIWPLPQFLHPHFKLGGSHVPRRAPSAHLAFLFTCQPHITSPDALQVLIWLTIATLSTRLLLHTSPDEPQLLVWPLPQLLHPLFTHCRSHVPRRAPSARLVFLFTANNTSQAQTSHECLSRLIFHSFTSSPPLLLTYYLMQAQMSHNCFLASSSTSLPSIYMSQVTHTQMSHIFYSFLPLILLFSHKSR
jgi:hypothetical protein